MSDGFVQEQQIPGPLDTYDPGGRFCEMLGRGDHPCEHTVALRERLNRQSLDTLRQRAHDAELELYNFGVTFTVYTQKEAIDRILPFDVIPRIISAQDWAVLERGVVQRVAAINRFLHDVYHEEKILKDGAVPRDLVLGNAECNVVPYRVIDEERVLMHDADALVPGTHVLRNVCTVDRHSTARGTDQSAEDIQQR
jgi:uncharacterized circularly permuted ATP-grasp superfamily protein